MGDGAKRWMISVIKPFLLALLNEPKYDYASLLPDEGRPLETIKGFKESEEEIVKISKDSLIKKFEIRLK